MLETVAIVLGISSCVSEEPHLNCELNNAFNFSFLTFRDESTGQSLVPLKRELAAAWSSTINVGVLMNLNSGTRQNLVSNCGLSFSNKVGIAPEKTVGA